MKNVQITFLWPSCHYLWYYLKASAHFNSPSLTLFLTFTFYTHISLTFSTRMLIRSALIFPNTHSCLLFCHHICSCPQASPICLSNTTLRYLVFSFISSSCLLSHIALCFCCCCFCFSWQYKHFVVFSIFSAVSLNFFFFFSSCSLLLFTTREKRMPSLCCIFIFMMKWLFGLWQSVGCV